MRLHQSKPLNKPIGRFGGISANTSEARANPALTARRKHRLLRALGGTALALVALSAAGAVFETIAASGDAERYPATGQLVDVGGHRLHIACLGQGSPMVVLDAGLGGSSRDWVLIQNRLSATTQVCAYDRAGMGWSDAGPEPRSPARIAEELHTLLVNAGAIGPYILVAHSLSGKSSRLFAAAHPDDVAGMVLVDTRSEWVDSRISPAETEAFYSAVTWQSTLLSVARRLGLVRLVGASIADQPALAPGIAAEMALLETQPKSLLATKQEGLARSASDAALTGASLGAIPLVVIAAGDSMAGIPDWAEAQAALAALSAQGRLIVAEGSSHAVQMDQPEIVIRAVESVLDAVRKGE